MRNVTILLLGFLATFSGSLGADTHEPGKFLSAIAGSKTEGEEIVKHFCASCHAKDAPINIGAPEMHNYNMWKPRIDGRYEELIRNVFNGVNMMPPRGGCFECSDEQIMLAIIAMLPEKLQSELIKLNKS